MADCTELAENIVKIGMAISTREDIETFDDMTVELIKIFPQLTRESISDAFLEVTTKEAKKTDDLTRKLNEIRRTPKIEKATQDKIDELNKLLETGEKPKKVKTRKAQSVKIEQLRQTRDNLRKWVETGDPVMKEKLNKELEELTDKFESGDIEINQRKGELHDEIQAIKDEIDSLKKMISESRKEQSLKDKIELLQAHLDAGTIPEVNKRVLSGTESTKMLRSILYDLRKSLNRSEPAVRKRLEKSIADLEQKLKSGDILPKQKASPVESKEIDELVYKREMIKREIQDEIKNLKPMTFWQKVGAMWDLARLMMTTGEFSFALRQGGVYAFSHPFKWSNALANSFRSFASVKSLYDINKDIFNRENAPLYMKSGLPLLHEGMSLTRSEEVIMNYWMDKLPVIRNFNRAAIAFFNTMRADLFDIGYNTLGKTDTMTLAEAEIWTNYISVMSGRGKLSIGSLNLEPAALAFNRTFFSARYVASRFQLLLGQPFFYRGKSGEGSLRARKLIAKEYIRLGIGLLTVFSMGLFVGADIEDDPRSSDFGKLKFGNRRLDPLMGMSQVITFMSRILTGKTKTARGNLVSLRGEDKKYGSQDILDIMARFGRSKLSPQFGFMMNLITGETMTGEEVNLLNTGTQLVHPMTYGDIWDVMQEEGIPTDIGLSILAFFGMGLQTYDSGEKQTERGSF